MRLTKTACRAKRHVDSEQIAFVEFDSVFREQVPILIDEWPYAVVCFLGSDVPPEAFDVRWADRKGCIAILPVESRDPLPDPSGRTLLDRSEHVRDRVSRFEGGEQMDVICDASDVERHTTDLTDAPTQVFVHS